MKQILLLLLFTLPLYSSSAWITTVKKGDLKKAQSMILNGIDIDYQDSSGKTALIWSILSEQHQIYNLLLNNGADPSTKDQLGLTVYDYLIEKIKHYRNEVAQNDVQIKLNQQKLRENRTRLLRLIPELKKQDEAMRVIFLEIATLTEQLQNNDQELKKLKEEIATLEQQMKRNEIKIEQQLNRLKRDLLEINSGPIDEQ